jgi:hypothetical protein
MSTNATAQLNGTGYADLPVTKGPGWHGLVASDMLFNNLSTGLFLTAALGELVAPTIFSPVAKLAYPLALAFLVADLVCLVLDLGDPLRFHHMLRVFKPSSPMSLGTWCLTVYSIPLTLIVALDLLASGWAALEWVRTAILILGLLPALGSAAYKGVLLSTNAQPGWRDGRWLGGYLSNSALLLGCAGVLALAILLGESVAGTVLRRALAVLLILNVVALVCLIADLRATLALIYTPTQLWCIGMLVLVGGMLVPWCLLFVNWPPLVLLAVLVVLLGSLAIRLILIKIPHQA